MTPKDVLKKQMLYFFSMGKVLTNILYNIDRDIEEICLGK